MRSFVGFLERHDDPEGPSTQIVRGLGPKIQTLSGFLDLETLLFGYLDPYGDGFTYKQVLFFCCWR